ncbi:MAG: glycosyltransferase family 2 protein [Pseudomonadota bacterium]
MIQRILKKFPYLKDFVFSIYGIYDEIDTLKSRLDVSDDLFDQFQKDRKSEGYQSIFRKENPLVTVCIATYNRGNTLLGRSLRSILRQDYENFEIIVVGDCCTDNTEELINTIEDKRLRFINLPERGKYPMDPNWRWMVAGTEAVNHALGMATGDFLTHLDDDDEHSPDRISKLVRFIQDTRADIVWHPFWRQTATWKWRLKSAEYLKRNEVTSSSAFYHKWFKRIPWDINAYKYREPGDWNRFRKFKYLGARTCRFPEPLLKHYKERNQRLE